MSQPPKKQPERSVETHVYMTPAIKKQLERVAKKQHRSVTGQIMYYVQRGISQDEAPFHE